MVKLTRSLILACLLFSAKALWGGIVGLRLSEELAGRDMPRAQTATKSLSHQHVLSPEVRNIQGALGILLKLGAKAAMRLREQKQKCKVLHVAIKDQYTFEKFEASVSFQETNDTFFLLNQIRALVQHSKCQKPMKVYVAVGGLTNESEEQLSLFANPKSQKLGYIMDLVNKKFGPNTLMSAGILEVTDQAKTRIAFNHIPELKDEFE